MTSHTAIVLGLYGDFIIADIVAVEQYHKIGLVKTEINPENLITYIGWITILLAVFTIILDIFYYRKHKELIIIDKIFPFFEQIDNNFIGW